jgi:hypothetical protein
MSDGRAIEAVTAALLQLIDAAVNENGGGVRVVAAPPHEVATTADPLQVNLFLYQTEMDPALRNEDALDRLPGETGDPPLPLVLHYLLTPYVRDGKDLDAHRLLGLAVRALHEHTVLSRADLTDAAPFSDLAQQLDRVRLSWETLEEKDIFSLWSAFQTPYRLSAAFQARPVLVDSRRPPRTPVPVLRRGRQDDGPAAQGGVASPFPELTGAAPAAGQPATVTAEQVVVRGRNLSAQAVRVLLRHPLLADPLLLIPDSAAAGEVLFTVPAAQPAGLGSVSLELDTQVDADPVTTVTNEVPLAVGPTITNPMPAVVARGPGGTALVTLTCLPPPLPGQPVLLLLDGRAVPADPPADPPGPLDELRFTIPDAGPGTHRVRLRVGGVDSRLVDRTDHPPAFRPDQTLTVQ